MGLKENIVEGIVRDLCEQRGDWFEEDEVDGQTTEYEGSINDDGIIEMRDDDRIRHFRIVIEEIEVGWEPSDK